MCAFNIPNSKLNYFHAKENISLDLNSIDYCEQ